MTKPRRVVRWTLIALVACRLALAGLLVSGVAVPSLVLRAMEASILAPVVACTLFFRGDYRRHRRASLPPRAAALAAADAMFPLAFRRLVVHEVRLFTSFVRWISLRGPQGVQEGDLVVRYAAGQTFVVVAVLFASVVETVGLGFAIPWPVVRDVVLIVDLWGVYFVIALQASCVVHPHVVRADGSLLLRYGALAEIPIPAARIARARLETRLDRGGPLKLRADGCSTWEWAARRWSPWS